LTIIDPRQSAVGTAGIRLAVNHLLQQSLGLLKFPLLLEARRQNEFAFAIFRVQRQRFLQQINGFREV